MKNFETKFGIGDLVCIIYEAEKGEVNRQEITGIIINKNGDRRYIIGALQFREEQLISETEALKIAIDYYRNQIRMLQEILEEKGKSVCEDTTQKEKISDREG